MSPVLRNFTCHMKVYRDICNLRHQLKHYHFSLQSAHLITTVTVEILTGFFNYHFTAHQLSQHVSSASLSSER